MWPVYTFKPSHVLYCSFGFMVNQGQIRRYRSIEDQARLSVYYFVVAKKIYSGGFTVSKEGKKSHFAYFRYITKITTYSFTPYLLNSHCPYYSFNFFISFLH